jgi:hypothetical protein
MYSTLAQAKLMVWHHNNQSVSGLVRHAANSHQWNFVKAQWPKFAMEPQNVRLGMATNGVNPLEIKVLLGQLGQ